MTDIENKKLNIGIKELHEVKMSSEEKKRILENVLNFPIPSTYTKSPYASSFFISIFRKHHFVFSSMMILAIIIFTSGGVVYASENSLPGSVFFPIKVKVVEPIHNALLFSPKAKAQYESELAMKRLTEAEALANQGKLDKEKEKELNTLLLDHTTAFNEAIKKAEEEEKTSENTDEIVSNFHDGMDAHAQALDDITTKENVPDENTDENITDQNKIEENRPEHKDEEINISKTAHKNAEDTKDHSRNREDKEEKEGEDN